MKNFMPVTLEAVLEAGLFTISAGERQDHCLSAEMNIDKAGAAVIGSLPWNRTGIRPCPPVLFYRAVSLQS
jgi:hypothetical protein